MALEAFERDMREGKADSAGSKRLSTVRVGRPWGPIDERKEIAIVDGALLVLRRLVAPDRALHPLGVSIHPLTPGALDRWQSKIIRFTNPLGTQCHAIAPSVLLLDSQVVTGALSDGAQLIGMRTDVKMIIGLYDTSKGEALQRGPRLFAKIAESGFIENKSHFLHRGDAVITADLILTGIMSEAQLCNASDPLSPFLFDFLDQVSGCQVSVPFARVTSIEMEEWTTGMMCRFCGAIDVADEGLGHLLAKRVRRGRPDDPKPIWTLVRAPQCMIIMVQGDNRSFTFPRYVRVDHSDKASRYRLGGCVVSTADGAHYETLLARETFGRLLRVYDGVIGDGVNCLDGASMFFIRCPARVLRYDLMGTDERDTAL